MITVMRIGLQIPNFTLGVPDDQLFEAVVQLAVAAEDVGVRVAVGDGPLLPTACRWAGPPSPCSSPTPCSAAWRRARAGSRLGTMVTGVTYRNPALLAKIVTTLDVISAGRAMLGIGAAWYDVEHEGLGVDFPPVGERMDRLEEAVQICRAMFREDVATFSGKLLLGARGPEPAPPCPARWPAHPDRRGRARSGRCGWWRATPTSATSPATPPPSPQGRACCARALRSSGPRPGVGHRQPLEHARHHRLGRGDEARRGSCSTARPARTPTGFNVGTEDEIVAQVEELAAAGVEYCHLQHADVGRRRRAARRGVAGHGLARGRVAPPEAAQSPSARPDAVPGVAAGSFTTMVSATLSWRHCRLSSHRHHRGSRMPIQLRKPKRLWMATRPKARHPLSAVPSPRSGRMCIHRFPNVRPCASW